MFLLLSGFILSEELLDYYCFGTQERCTKYLYACNMDLDSFLIFESSTIAEHMENLKVGSFLIFTEKVDHAITIDYTKSTEKYFYTMIVGNEHSPRITINYPNHDCEKTIGSDSMYIDIILGSADSNPIAAMIVSRSKLSINIDCSCGAFGFDSRSHVVGNHKLNILLEAQIDYNADMTNIVLGNNVNLVKCIPSDANFMEVEPNKLNFYTDKEKDPILSIERGNNDKFQYMQSFFDPQKVDGVSIMDIYLKNPQLPSSDYKKVDITTATKSLRFTGDYPESADYIFNIYSEKIILNSTRVPVQDKRQSSEFIIQTSEYHFENFIKSQNSIAILTHKDFKDQRIKIIAHSSSYITFNRFSPNMDINYDVLEGSNNNMYIMFDERGVSTYTFNKIKFNNQNLRFTFRALLPAYFDDSMLAKYDTPCQCIIINNNSENILGNIAINFENAYGKYEFVSKIFDSTKEIINDKIICSIQKIKNVPKFTPNMYICDKICTSYELSLWFKKENISKIYDYFNPDGNATIRFQSNILTDVFEFGKLPKFDEYSYLTFSSGGQVKIDVKGELNLHKLTLNYISFNPIDKTDLNVNKLELRGSTSLFNQHLTYSSDLAVSVEFSALDSVPEDITDRTLLIYYEKLYFTESTIHVVTEDNKATDITNKGYKIAGMHNSLDCYMNDTKPITHAKFPNIIIAYNDRGTTMKFLGNWENCFVDFFDFSQLRDLNHVRVRYNENSTIPFIDFKDTTFSLSMYNNNQDTETICLRLDDSVPTTHCASSDSNNFTFEDGLKYLESLRSKSVKIYIYQSGDIITFTPKQLNFTNVLISSGDSEKPRIKLPNFSPLQESFKLKNLKLVLDSKDGFLLHGTHTNVDLEISQNIGKCFYYLDKYQISIVKLFNEPRISSYYKSSDVSIYELTQSIYIIGYSSNLNFNGNDDVDVVIDSKYYGFGLKKNEAVKIYKRTSQYLVFDFENSINAYITSSDSEKTLRFMGSALKIVLNSPFKEVNFDYKCNSNLIITDKSGFKWGDLTIRGDLYLDTPFINTNKLVFQDANYVQSIYCSEKTRCKINTNIFEDSNSPKILLDKNIDLTIETFKGDYPFIHSFSLTEISKTTIDQFEFNNKFVLCLQPDIEKDAVVDADLAAFSTPIDIVFINTTVADYQDEYEFVNSNIYGLKNGASVVSISHTEEKITFVVDKKLESLTSDLCYSEFSENCTEGQIYISALTVEEIKKAQPNQVINLYVMIDEIKELSLNFAEKDHSINFIHPGEEKCKIKITGFSNIIELSFNNFIIDATVDFNNKGRAGYKNCEITAKNQNYGIVQVDLESLSILNTRYVKEIIIDSDSKITYYKQLKYSILINDQIFEPYSYDSITLDQRSLTSGMTLSLFDIECKFVVNLQTDFELKIAGRFSVEETGIQLTGTGILTCNVIDTTKDFFVVEKDKDRIVKNIVDPSKIVYCVNDTCAEGSTQVSETDIGDKIQENNLDDYIEVVVGEKVETPFKTSQLKAKYVHIISESKCNIILNPDSDSGLIMLNLTNIEVDLLSQNEVDVFSLSLDHSRITNSNNIDITINSYVELDMYYMIPEGCLKIKTYWHFEPKNENSVEIPSFRILYMNQILDILIYEDSNIKIDFEENNDNILLLYSNDIMMTKITKNYNDNIRFIKEDDSNTLFFTSNVKYQLSFDFPATNTVLAIKDNIEITRNFPQKIFLLGEATIHSDLYLSNDVELINENLERFKIYVYCLKFEKHKIILKSGNIDFWTTGKTDYITDEIPIVSTIDETGVSSFNVFSSSVSGADDWISLPLRIGFKSPPSDTDIVLSENQEIGSFSFSGYPGDRSPTTIKYIYDTKYHGLWEGNSVLKLTSTTCVKLYLSRDGSIQTSPMKICVGSDSQCPRDSIAINDNFALSSRVPKLLNELEIQVVTHNNKKIDLEFESKDMNVLIHSLSQAGVGEVTLENVDLLINRLELNNVKVAADMLNLSINNLIVHNSQVPDAVYNFKNDFAAVIDYDAFKVIKYDEMMKKLTIDNCNSLNIFFTSEGWKLDDGSSIKLTDFEVSYSGASIDTVQLRIEDNNRVCNGMKITGNVKKLHCLGEQSWQSSQTSGEIVWDHGANDVTLKSDGTVSLFGASLSQRRNFF